MITTHTLWQSVEHVHINEVGFTSGLIPTAGGVLSRCHSCFLAILNKLRGSQPCADNPANMMLSWCYISEQSRLDMLKMKDEQKIATLSQCTTKFKIKWQVAWINVRIRDFPTKGLEPANFRFEKVTWKVVRKTGKGLTTSVSTSWPCMVATGLMNLKPLLLHQFYPHPDWSENVNPSE